MVNNRRSFLKGVAGVFGVVTGGALLPKIGNANASDKMLFVNGKEVCKYLCAWIGRNQIAWMREPQLRIAIEKEEWKRSIYMRNTYDRRLSYAIMAMCDLETLELHDNGNVRRWDCELSAGGDAYVAMQETIAILSVYLHAEIV